VRRVAVDLSENVLTFSEESIDKKCEEQAFGLSRKAMFKFSMRYRKFSFFSFL
jgi:hypothetical protein